MVFWWLFGQPLEPLASPPKNCCLRRRRRHRRHRRHRLASTAAGIKMISLSLSSDLKLEIKCGAGSGVQQQYYWHRTTK
jgi:hypothetical protein